MVQAKAYLNLNIKAQFLRFGSKHSNMDLQMFSFFYTA